MDLESSPKKQRHLLLSSAPPSSLSLLRLKLNLKDWQSKTQPHPLEQDCLPLLSTSKSSSTSNPTSPSQKSLPLLLTSKSSSTSNPTSPSQKSLPFTMDSDKTGHFPNFPTIPVISRALTSSSSSQVKAYS